MQKFQESAGIKDKFDNIPQYTYLQHYFQNIISIIF